MLRAFRPFLAAAAFALLGAAQPFAQDSVTLPAELYDPTPLGIELRIGGAVSQVEIFTWEGAYSPRFETFDIKNLDTLQVDAIFDLPDWDALKWIGNPRLELGGLINLAGRESIAHAALNWQIPVFDTPFFVELAAGGGIHNGAVEADWPLRDMGCSYGFHYSYGVGATYENFVGVLKLSHISQAGLCSQEFNQGLNMIGFVAGYKF